MPVEPVQVTAAEPEPATELALTFVGGFSEPVVTDAAAVPAEGQKARAAAPTMVRKPSAATATRTRAVTGVSRTRPLPLAARMTWLLKVVDPHRRWDEATPRIASPQRAADVWD